MKVVIEMEDTLNETVEQVIEEAKEALLDKLRDNPDCETWHCLQDKWTYNGGDHEVCDSNVPLYTKEIDDLYYLYGEEFEEAYRNAGIGDGSEDNHKMSAIYCYLQEKMWDGINEWGEELIDAVNERRAELEDEISELEGQLEDASDADDEDLVNRLEAEIDALDVETKMQEYVDDLSTDSI